MTNEQKEVNCRIAKYHGNEQIGVCIEECAELIQALCKYKRLSSGQPPRKTRAEIIRDITEEIADVTIMIEQVKELLHIKDESVHVSVNNNELLNILNRVRMRCETLDLIYPVDIKKKRGDSK